MERRSLVSRGMAVLGAGGACTREAHLRDNSVVSPDAIAEGARQDCTTGLAKNLQPNAFKYHVDFSSDVPGETAELWVGTPYAAWIERDVRRRHSKEHMAQINELQEQLRQEVQRRRAVEQELEEAREELKKVPELQAALTESRQTLMKYVEKGLAISGLGNIHAVCRNILHQWRRHTTVNTIDRLRRRTPDVGRCHFELLQLHEQGLEHLKAVQVDMLNAVTRFMDKDAMIIPDREEPDEALRMSFALWDGALVEAVDVNWECELWHLPPVGEGHRSRAGLALGSLGRRLAAGLSPISADENLMPDWERGTWQESLLNLSGHEVKLRKLPLKPLPRTGSERVRRSSGHERLPDEFMPRVGPSARVSQPRTMHRAQTRSLGDSAEFVRTKMTSDVVECFYFDSGPLAELNNQVSKSKPYATPFSPKSNAAWRKLKELCLTEDGQCVRCASTGGSTCDDGASLGSTLETCITQQPTQAMDSWFDSVPDWTRQAQSVTIGDTLDSKCLEVESFSMNRNLVEHGLPLMLRVPEIGSRFSEYFVCVHKGGENFSLLDRRISREKHNFHYAWEDVSIYHYIQSLLPQDESSSEVAAERPAQALKNYYTDEVVRCTFSDKCNPRQIDLMFRTKQALQCWVHLMQSKLLAKMSQEAWTSVSGL
ncbi:unnamed protein product [Symbiodinium pilosum]|uniref:Uncharacterized protein n=1 Tax=Symbiodinium pilosum TaxID=2952 RepID=A0A812P1Y5_SYMPI|nr:unnamed protein product [Symbiodinium pilosum]